MNTEIVDFYRSVREDSDLLARLSGCETEAELVDRAVALGAERGFSFTAEDARAGLQDLTTLVNQAANDDELNDFELELVAAGASPASTGQKDM